MRKWLSRFFAFSSGERRAITAIVIITLVTTAGLYAYKYYMLSSQSSSPKYTAEIEAFAKQYNTDELHSSQYTDTASLSNTNAVAGDLFYFNPNIIGKVDWIKLGLTEKQATSIEKYKAKGGRFYKPEDLSRLYVLSKQDVGRLLPYVQITGDVIKPNELIELNTADSVTIETLPGIGPVLTHKILAYRTKLGGYIAVEQLQEIQSLPIETYEAVKPRLRVNTKLALKIDINTTNENTLKIHPYIKAPLAKAIVKYRDKNGNFKSTEEMMNVAGMTDSMYRKAAPYLIAE